MDDPIKPKNILEIFSTSDTESFYRYEIVKTTITRERKLFSIFPIWKNSKFRWLKNTVVLERKYYSRRLEFDDGWSYQYYWSDWKVEWRIEEILK